MRSGRNNKRFNKSKKRKRTTALPNKNHQCDKCNKRFPKNSQLLNHKSEKHNISIPCSKCTKTFRTTAYLKKHLKRHERSLTQKMHKWKCALCSSSFSDKRFLQRHCSMAHKSRLTSCQPCKLTFDTFKGYQHHLRNECENALECAACNYKTSLLSSMRFHVQRHLKNYSHICQDCNKGYYNQSALDAHRKIHMNESTPCDVCGKLYVNKLSFEKHRMRFHPELYAEIHHCTVCHYVTKKKETFDRHTASHKEPRYVCEMCGKALSNATSLNTHRRTHTGEKPFECKVCGKKFVSANYLRSHRLTHTGERRHSCANCLQTFARRGSYRNHLKTCEAQPEVPAKQILDPKPFFTVCPSRILFDSKV